jgi:hypothetical protein
MFAKRKVLLCNTIDQAERGALRIEDPAHTAEAFIG